MTLAADEVVRLLDLVPHPEGGWYRETYRHRPPEGGRGVKTAIYYLLRRGEHSAWHRIRDAVEVWNFYAGAPLQLEVSSDGRERASYDLGRNLPAGERPQVVVPAGVWQTAVSRGEWTLVGCTVSPAFDFAAFEMAPPGWQPG